MSKSQVLTTEPRTKKGTRHARALRGRGMIPACLLSDGTSPTVDFAISVHEFLTARRHHVHVFELDLSGSPETALVRELQWDTFGEGILHIDFKRVRTDVETEAEVELEFMGHTKSGVLNHLVTHVTVRCIPTLIPDMLEVPVAHLEQGGVIQAKDLVLPEGVYLAIPPGTAIANAVAIKVEAEPTEAEAAAEGVVPGAAPAATAEGAPKAAPKAAPKEGKGKDS
jgi:large subunit ribosomal protein L25